MYIFYKCLGNELTTLTVKKMRKPHNIVDRKPDSIWSFYLKCLLHNVILNYIIKVNKTNLHSVNYKFTETPKEKKQKKMLFLGNFWRYQIVKSYISCLISCTKLILEFHLLKNDFFAKFCKNYGIIWRSYDLYLLSNILLDIFSRLLNCE